MGVGNAEAGGATAKKGSETVEGRADELGLSSNKVSLTGTWGWITSFLKEKEI